jgi:predicted ATPase
MRVTQVSIRETDWPGWESPDWPYSIPAVQQLCAPGLVLRKPVTFLVGDNGSGKSTIIEAIADAYGLDVRGGHGDRKYAVQPSQESPLGAALTLRRPAGTRGTAGFFLRAETALGVLSFMSDNGVKGYGDRHLAQVSHGESFLQVVEGRFRRPGLYLLDEPESALSFDGCLRLMSYFDLLTRAGGQVICASHSPILTAMPNADIFLLDETGFAATAWDDLSFVQHWRTFLDDPALYLGPLLEED